MKWSNVKIVRGIFMLLLLAASVQIAAQTEPEQFPLGQIVDPVVAKANPQQTYALYLPKGYTPDKKWPILYCFDPRERGTRPAEQFKPAAEQYGWILASSNNTRSDDSTYPNMQAVRAMWEDTHKRFSLDDARAYGTGFSGGARIACDMGYMYTGNVAGVIGAGAGFPIDRPPSSDTPFIFFGIIGNTDFNYHELRLLEVQLTKAALPHRIESFNGGHEWHPQWIATEAVEWMEVRAMKDRKREVDNALVERLFERRMQGAQKQEAEGKPYHAYQNYKQALDDFQGLREDLQALQTKVTALEESEQVRQFVQNQERRDAEDAEFRKKFGTVIKAMRSGDDAPLSLEKIREGLGLDALLKKAADSRDPEEQLSAQRKLEAVFVNTWFYLPRGFMQREQYQRAVVSYSIASEIKPEEPDIWYFLACAHSMNGDQKKALAALQKAVDKGYSDVQKLQSDIDLKALREEKGFKELLKKVERKKSAAQP